MTNPAQDATFTARNIERLEAQVSKFYNIQLARAYRNRTKKASMMLHGDDGMYWVATMAVAAQLERAGYEIVK